jgi:hypothetical protein
VREPSSNVDDGGKIKDMNMYQIRHECSNFGRSVLVSAKIAGLESLKTCSETSLLENYSISQNIAAIQPSNTVNWSWS